MYLLNEILVKNVVDSDIFLNLLFLCKIKKFKNKRDEKSRALLL